MVVYGYLLLYIWFYICNYFGVVMLNCKHFLSFEEFFGQKCIFLQKDLQGVVCHSNFAVQSSRGEGRLQAKRLLRAHNKNPCERPLPFAGFHRFMVYLFTTRLNPYTPLGNYHPIYKSVLTICSLYLLDGKVGATSET